MVAKDEDGNDSFRATVLHYMEGGPVTVFITILVVFALSITLANLFGVDGKSDLFESFDLFLSCAFLLEILLRIYAMGPVPYFEYVISHLNRQFLYTRIRPFNRYCLQCCVCTSALTGE